MRRAILSCLLLAVSAACSPVSREPDLSGPALVQLYESTSARIKSDGGLRTERIPKDAPLSLPLLERNFMEIAFFSEYPDGFTGPLRRASSIPLTRWEGPVRVGAIIGNSVSAAQASKDIAEIRRLVRRFAKTTGRDVRYIGEGNVNFIVLVLARNEQLALADAIEQNAGLPRELAFDLRNSPPSLLCSASLFGPAPDNGGIAVAVALIKAEHKGLMRQSCFHEEMTQAMGLLNDSKRVRPSIFNDDEEFALLTLHDEILLRMLYDRRLRSGMTLNAARPLIPAIARDAAHAAGVRFLPAPAD